MPKIEKAESASSPTAGATASGAASRSTRIKQASSQRRERQKEAMRGVILQAAGQEFLEFGYEGFSLRRVAERIGYSATTIYLYFKDKDELLLATVQDGFREFDSTLLAAAQTTLEPLEKIVALGQAYVEFGLSHPALYRLMFMQPQDFHLLPRLLGSGTPAEELQAPPSTPHHRVVSQELLVSAVQKAMEAGHIPHQDPVNLADALWAGAHGVVALACSPLMPPEHAQKTSACLLRLLVDGMRS